MLQVSCPAGEALEDKWCLCDLPKVTWDAGQGKRNRETSVGQESPEFSTSVKIQLWIFHKTSELAIEESRNTRSWRWPSSKPACRNSCTAQVCFFLDGLNAAYFPLLVGRLFFPFITPFSQVFCYTSLKSQSRGGLQLVYETGPCCLPRQPGGTGSSRTSYLLPPGDP